MNYHEFLGAVQHRCEMATTQQAVSATRATLETLAARITEGQATDMAAQLPQELGIYLADAQPKPERFSAQEFLERVAEREEVDLPQAVYHARVVLEVLGEALTAPEFEHLQAQLPDEYAALFEAGSEGELDLG